MSRWIPGWVATAFGIATLLAVPRVLWAVPKSAQDMNGWVVLIANIGTSLICTTLLLRYYAVRFSCLLTRLYSMLSILTLIVTYHQLQLGEWGGMGHLLTEGALLPLGVEGLYNAERAKRSQGRPVQESWRFTMAATALLGLGHQLLHLRDLYLSTHLFLVSLWGSSVLSFVCESFNAGSLRHKGNTEQNQTC